MGERYYALDGTKAERTPDNKEYRIMAYFHGKIYSPRSYKRKIFASLEEAQSCLEEATRFYSGYPYSNWLKKVVIESRSVSEWTAEKEEG